MDVIRGEVDPKKSPCLVSNPRTTCKKTCIQDMSQGLGNTSPDPVIIEKCFRISNTRRMYGRVQREGGRVVPGDLEPSFLGDLNSLQSWKGKHYTCSTEYALSNMKHVFRCSC